MIPGPVARFENGREVGWMRPDFTGTTRGQPGPQANPIRPFLSPLANFATCVDAPFGAREIFRSGVARGRVLTCVRPLLRRVSCRGPRWESEDQVQFKPTRLTRLSQSWLSRSGLLTVAPSLSSDPPTPDS